MSSKPNNPEPFGYFRAMPFGWEDCAATDEGSRALYDEDAISTQAARIAELEAEVERLRKPLPPERAWKLWAEACKVERPTVALVEAFARAIEAVKEGK